MLSSFKVVKSGKRHGVRPSSVAVEGEVVTPSEVRVEDGGQNRVRGGTVRVRYVVRRPSP